MTAMVFVMIVIQAALLWVAVTILQQIRVVCELLKSQPKRGVGAPPANFYPYSSPQAALFYPYSSPQAALFYPYASPRPSGNGAFAIWCWRGTCWELESGSVPAGLQPGKPPTYQGLFVGQRVKSECNRR